MPEIVPATNDLLAKIWDRPAPRTIRALAVTEGDAVLGVAGYYMEEGKIVMIAEIADEARREIKRYRRPLILCARRLMDEVIARGMPILASADPDIEGSDMLLTHFGFGPVRKGIYQWRGPV